MTARGCAGSPGSDADGDFPLSWEPARIPPPLAPGELHLWLVRADPKTGDTDSLLDLLEEHQRLRAARMTRPEIRARYVLAQAGYRRILSGYLGCSPGAVRFDHGPAGKPGLGPHGTDLESNLTTTGDIALVAVRRGEPVGVDCERIRPCPNLDAVAARMFDPSAINALATAPESERCALFHRAWTALEADCKCDGRGLFRPRAPNAVRPQVANFRPLDEHVAAVASPALPPRERWKTLELAPIEPA